MRVTVHIAKAGGKLSREFLNSSFFSCLQIRNGSLPGRYQTEISWAKSSAVWIKYLYKPFYRQCHLGSLSMSRSGEAKRSSGRCCLKAFVGPGMKKEETQHISDKSKPFSLQYMMCIRDFADGVVYTYV